MLLGVHHWHQFVFSCFHLMKRCCGRKKVANKALFYSDFEVDQAGTAQFHEWNFEPLSGCQLAT